MLQLQHIATVVAVDLGDALEHAKIGAIPLLLGFITVTGAVGMLIVGAIPKWAIFAPIFVPLFMKLGSAPESCWRRTASTTRRRTASRR